MATPYKLDLKVSRPSGEIILAKITPMQNGRINLELPYIEAIKKDKELNCPSGIFRKEYPREQHREIIDKLTNYLESLFLKELSNEVNNTGKHSGSKPTRAKKPINPKPTEPSKGEKPGGLHGSGRGRKPSGSSGRREPKPELVKESDSES